MSIGVFNQVIWKGVGDVDECWIIATYWALVASGTMRRSELPSISKFRAAAKNPDRPGSTGGNNSDLMLALGKLAPGAKAVKFDGNRTGFTNMLKKGYIASLSVWSGALPTAYQFGYKGAHQISVYYEKGKYYVMNPLAREGSALMEINYNSLVYAANALGGPGWSRNPMMHAVFIKAKPKPAPKAVKPKAQGKPSLRPPTGVPNYIDGEWARKFYLATRPESDLGNLR